MRLLKNAYEQNLARCIAAAQGADFFSLFLIPDPTVHCCQGLTSGIRDPKGTFALATWPIG